MPDIRRFSLAIPHPFLMAFLLTGGLAANGCQGPASAGDQLVSRPISAKPVPLYSAKAFHETRVFSLSTAQQGTFSPDGESILISSDESGVFNAYALPLAGGSRQPLTTSQNNATFAISYFPDDERILFGADQAGNELRHVYVRELDGRVKDLTPGDKHQASFLGWSSDGSRFWLTTNERDPSRHDVYEYNTDTYSRKLVYKNNGFQVAAISPNGRWLGLVKLHGSSDFKLYLADLQAGAGPKLINPDTQNADQWVLGFTPDSRSLIYRTDEFGEFRQAWQYNVLTGEKQPLVAENSDLLFVRYSPRGRYRVTALKVDASIRLTIDEVSSGRPIPLRGLPEGNISAARFNEDESKVALTVASDTSPQDIFIADVRTGETKRLTNALNPEVREQDLVAGRVVRYRSFDGVEIPSVLYKPHAASERNKVPAVIWIHGGPGGEFMRGYSAEIQHLVNAGYAVFAVNYRGSQGYGKTFYHLDDQRHGEDDLKDILASKTYLSSLDWIDSTKIGVMGESYGGFLTAAALASFPEAFDVGIDIFGVTNWIRTINSFPQGHPAREWMIGEVGDPVKDADRLRRISPLFKAKNIVKPLLVLQGENDPRVLKAESDELVQAVRANNVPVEYIVFPDEGHGFQRRENRIKASEAYVRFLERYLRK